jgi:hypothetical protein
MAMYWMNVAIVVALAYQMVSVTVMAMYWMNVAIVVVIILPVPIVVMK